MIINSELEDHKHVKHCQYSTIPKCIYVVLQCQCGYLPALTCASLCLFLLLLITNTKHECFAHTQWDLVQEPTAALYFFYFLAQDSRQRNPKQRTFMTAAMSHTQQKSVWGRQRKGFDFTRELAYFLPNVRIKTCIQAFISQQISVTLPSRGMRRSRSSKKMWQKTTNKASQCLTG